MSSWSEFRSGVGPEAPPAAAARPARIGQNLNVPAVSPERARAEARAEGFSVGWAEGHRAAATTVAEQTAQLLADEQARQDAYATRLHAALGALERAAAELARRSEPAVEQAGGLIADAAYTVAEALVGRELATAAQPGRDAIRRALTGAPERAPTVVVRLSPADVATLRSVSSELEIEGRTVTVLADPALRSGDAVAECDSTTLDARIVPALARVKEILSP